MKRTVLAVCVLSITGFLASGARASGRSDTKATEQQLTKMEHDWAQATLKRDTQALERMEADEYVYYVEGFKGGKNDDLADAKNGDFAADSIDESDITVRVIGDTAIVTGRTTLKNGKYKGKDISGDYMFTDTWVRRNGQWQVVASHTSKVQSM